MLQDPPRRLGHGRGKEGSGPGAERGDGRRPGGDRRTHVGAWHAPLGPSQLAAERLDLTEVIGAADSGHAHITTQAWERLEDVFIGLGFQVAEGPEVETDFYNFEALNMPPSHPARSMWDTFFVNHGAPGLDGVAHPHVARCRSG